MIISEKKVFDFKFKSKQFVPFDDSICNFVIDLSKKLLSSFDQREHPDITTLAFFCRKGNILNLKKEFNKSKKIRNGSKSTTCI